MRNLISKHDNFSLDALHYAPSGPRKGGVVVIQEIFGLTDHIHEMCARFAENGYEAIAPDLFARIEPGFLAAHSPEGIAKGVQAVQATPMAQVASDVQAALDAMEGPRFVTGFCYGGAVTWLAAQRCQGVAAASGFYGRLINNLLDRPLKAPIELHYGRNDAGIPLTEVDKVRAAFPDVPIHLYEAGHGFCRKGSADYHGLSCDLAMERTLALFARHSV
ncbi:MAG: dienelactone hydrolase family protein [Hyphomonadaceae bacterium]